MNTELQSALRAVNRRFYEQFAAEFDRRRQHPWTGWEKVAHCLDRVTGWPRAVLDVGCGNGRFGAFLAGRRRGSCRYLGVDDSAVLLAAAEQRLAGLFETPELRRLDVLEADLDRELGGERFDLVALFGVLHHVPGAVSRRDLLRQLSRRLRPGGMLAASIWRLDQTPRLARRVVPWAAYNLARSRRSLPPLETLALEAGDTLLTWDGDAEHPRYCHFPDEAELEALIAAPDPPLAGRFEADGPSGRDNLYLLWHDEQRRPGEASE